MQFGLGAAPLSFKTRIKRLIESYLGTESAPIPFGGRATELKQLNDWLSDSRSPRNLLITAPAGRGKTALLIRWVQQISDEWPVCFVPISIRHDTNRAVVFYQALAARLAALLGETLPQTMTDAEDFYKEKATEYLEQFTGERRCLVVVDGLDEAAGWRFDTAILPIVPSAGVRVVVSGRELAGDKGSEDWLRRLGWSDRRGAAKTIQVPRLTKAGISDVLLNMGFPLGDLAANVDVVAELYRLTEWGDPLLLKLYVEDLWNKGDEAARLRPEDLARLEPGFVAFFRDWFDQQRNLWLKAELEFDEEVVNASMLILSCAAGPMKLAVLSPIVQSLLGKKSLITRQTLEPIRRFVIGDGIGVGFVFAHPKLAFFIREDYFGGSNSVHDAKLAIANWGRSIVTGLNTGSIQPDAAPDYALLYYLQHLEEVGSQSGLMPYRELLEDGWRLAWLAHEDGVRGFARDLQVAWTKLRHAAEITPGALQQPKTGLGGLIRCALCLCSIRSVGSAVPANFMAELVRQQLVTVRQALYFSRFKLEAERVQTLQALSQYVLEADLDEAIADARTIEGLEEQGITLAMLAARADSSRRSELFAEANEVVERLPEEWKRSSVKLRIEALQKPPSAKDEVADSGASAVNVETSSAEYEKFVYPRPADLEAEFGEIVREPIEHFYDFQYRIGMLAPYLTDEMLTRSLAIGISDENWGVERMLTELSPFLSARHLEHAFDLIARLKEGYYLERALSALSQPLWEHHRARVMEFVSEERDGYYSEEYLKIFLPLMVEEEITAVLERLGTWKSYQREGAIRRVIDCLPPSLFEKTLTMLLALDDGESAPLLGYLLPLLPADLSAKALERFSTFGDYPRGRMIEAVGPRLAQSSIQTLIRLVAGNIADINRLLPFMSEEDRASTVAHTYKTSFKLGDGVSLAAALMTLSARLPETEARRAIGLALQIVDGISEREERVLTSILLLFSGLLSPETRNALVSGARTIGGQLRDKESATIIFAMLTLIPDATEADVEILLSRLLSTSADIDAGIAVLELIALSLNPRLSEADFRRALDHVMALVAGRAEKSDQDKDSLSVLNLLLGVLPRVPVEEAQAFVRKGIELMDEKNREVGLMIASLAPALPAVQANQYAVEALAPAKQEENYIDAILAPYLDVGPLRPIVVALLDKAISSTRGDLLFQMAMFEGQWLELVGVRPALGGGAGPQSTLGRLGGPSAIPEAYEAIEDVMRWWP